MAKQHYQEVLVEKVRGQNGKITTNTLKVIRDRVLITDEHAETLNQGVLANEDGQAKIYIKAPVKEKIKQPKIPVDLVDAPTEEDNTTVETKEGEVVVKSTKKK